MFTILVIASSQFFIRSFDSASVLIGRALDSDIVLPDLTVSRRHCRIHVEQQDFSVEDLNSTNGCCVNGLLCARRTMILPREELRLGTYALYLHPGQATIFNYLRRPTTLASDYSGHPTAQVKASVPARCPSAITQPTRLNLAHEVQALPTLGSLRKLIDRILVSDSDLDAFCLDHCPSTFTKFTTTMDRTSKVSLLLARTPPGEILRCLREEYPAVAEAERDLLAYEGS